ncbi:hypothetical protein EV385_0948 [Krasilnikovia cinnamomea]|uniref:Three-Cys-motif partner protein n=1 Tax=Krasilnikovia cinnamomea TaxID=349313 RepID=A0A4Q7ZEU9_9ACTN|nr:hypothetical protein EV385_0948 [Krasilnikovia cinnamomea]
MRHLEAWAPAALHRARHASYVHGYADADGGRAAEAAVRVFAELSDLVRGRELTMLAVGDDTTAAAARLATAQREGGVAAGLSVHTVDGGTDARLAVALAAGGAARVPLLGYLDATAAPGPPALATVAALAAGKPAEVLLVLAPGALEGLDGDPDAAVRVFGGPPGDGSRVDAYRAALRRAGFPLVAAVELVANGGPGQLLVFATASGKSLEGFKDTLWAVDEYAGVRYRDPGDPEGHLLDISLTPHPGPLRRELLGHLAEAGPATVTELRTFALTETVYRAADATRVLQALLAAGAVTRSPEHGRLGGDVVIAVADA